jgi:aspartokinase-like uncharacterized kinase
MSSANGPLVVKVGGSLFDLPDLREHLNALLSSHSTHRILLVPGGGGMADVVRELDRRHELGQERAHWLALRALSLSAHFLEHLVPSSEVVNALADCPGVWEHGKVAILDAFAFACADEGKTRSLPHHWDVTSDSIAARVAEVIGARSLLLLKSVDMPTGIDWNEAGRRGLVDRYFARAVSPTVAVEAINLRNWSAPKARQASPPGDGPRLLG